MVAMDRNDRGAESQRTKSFHTACSRTTLEKWYSKKWGRTSRR